MHFIASPSFPQVCSRHREETFYREIQSIYLTRGFIALPLMLLLCGTTALQLMMIMMITVITITIQNNSSIQYKRNYIRTFGVRSVGYKCLKNP